MKIAILGYSGCGKSTLAKYLSVQYHIPLLMVNLFDHGCCQAEKSNTPL